MFHVIRKGWKLRSDPVYQQSRVGLDIAFVIRFRDLKHLGRDLGDRGAMKSSSYVRVVLTRDQKADAARVGRFALAYHFRQYV